VDGAPERDHYRVLQVDPAACREVIEAAFGVLREKLLREDPPDAPRRLAELNAAHRELGDPERRAAYDGRRGRRREDGA
jgi:DnaJ-class molecular chaperone